MFSRVFSRGFLPRPSKGCFLEAFRYLKPTKKHPFEGTGMGCCFQCVPVLFLSINFGCLLFVVCCMLFVVCCMLFVVCCFCCFCFCFCCCCCHAIIFVSANLHVTCQFAM